MSFVSTTLFAVLLPAMVAAGVVGLARRFGRWWWSASAVGLASSAAHLALARPAFPPSDVTDRVFFIALAAVALAVFEAARRLGSPGRIAGRALLAALTLGLVLGPVIGNEALTVRLVASAVVALAAWANVEALAARGDASAAFGALLVTAAGAGLVLLLSGSAVLGQLGVALSAALAGAWLSSGFRTPEGFAPAGSAVLVALLVIGFVYASLPGLSALGLAVAPAAAWVVEVCPARRWNPWARAALGAAALAIPIGVAVALAISASPAYDD